MAKPTVRVVSSTVDLEAAPRLLRCVLDAASWKPVPSTPDEYGLFVTRDPLGLPHWLSIEGDESGELDEDLAELVGRDGVVTFVLAAQTSDERAHKSLGALALALAEACSGWIDLNGPLGEPDTIDDAQRYLQSLELGQNAHAIRYETAGGTPWLYVVMAPAPFRIWLDHPEFHLVC